MAERSTGTGAVADALARLTELADPAGLAQVNGVARLEVVGHRSHTVRFDGRTVTLLDDGKRHPDVVLTTGDEALMLALLTGRANLGLEYLAGRVAVDGDELLALSIGGIFVGPTGDRVDPTDLDPVKVAIAIDGVDPAHLEAVMASEVHGIVVAGIFDRLPRYLDVRRSARLRLRVAFAVTGGPGPDSEWLVEVDRGHARTQPFDGRGPVDARVTIAGHDLLRLATSHLSPAAGLLRGQLKIRGDRSKALLLSAVINFPSSKQEVHG
ncbi:SCP2 sterol-binding domain-containing protein [Nocardioides limicola]|uniref:SCP2 sterol-binding domain-containing protein n=1 Tax=Nocardioides limicola TaxID=2803368 RepID=UPI00193BC50E|nr:SCP2 sterol-binding domain-containing protein [Nocardioides sp. DJM-14]